MQAAQEQRRHRVVRSELPREAVERVRRRAQARARGARRASSSTWTCSSATRRTCRKGWAFRGRRSRPSRRWTPGAFLAMIDSVVARHPQIKVLATTLREVHSTNRHTWSAVAWIERQGVRRADVRARRARPRRRRRRLRVRAVLRPAERRNAGRGVEARMGARRAASRRFPGDTTMARWISAAFAKGGSARIQR